MTAEDLAYALSAAEKLEDSMNVGWFVFGTAIATLLVLALITVIIIKKELD